MDSELLYLTLAALAFAVALNLQLTLSVLRAARRVREVPEPLMPGQPVPSITAITAVGRARLQLPAPGQAWALLFLSSRCPKCRARLPEIEAMAAVAGQAGLAMWLVSEESPWRLRTFLRGTTLLSCAARARLKDYKQLNPSLSSPAYLFVDHDGILQAAGLIGDENWLGLQAQLAAADTDLEQAA